MAAASSLARHAQRHTHMPKHAMASATKNMRAPSHGHNHIAPLSRARHAGWRSRASIFRIGIRRTEHHCDTAALGRKGTHVRCILIHL